MNIKLKLKGFFRAQKIVYTQTTDILLYIARTWAAGNLKPLHTVFPFNN